MKIKNSYLAFVDLEKKTFNRKPQRMLWLAMRVVGVPKRSIAIVEAM